MWSRELFRESSRRIGFSRLWPPSLGTGALTMAALSRPQPLHETAVLKAIYWCNWLRRKHSPRWDWRIIVFLAKWLNIRGSLDNILLHFLCLRFIIAGLRRGRKKKKRSGQVYLPMESSDLRFGSFGDQIFVCSPRKLWLTFTKILM